MITGIVLVIERDDKVRSKIEEVLKELGFFVVTATTGAEGVAKAQRYLPIAIITEWELEDMGGHTMLDRIHEVLRIRETPIVVYPKHPELVLPEDLARVKAVIPKEENRLVDVGMAIASIIEQSTKS